MILKGQLKPLSILLMILFIGCLMLLINSNSTTINSNNNTSPTILNDIQELAEDIYLIQYDQNGNKKTQIKSELFTQYKSGIKSFSNPKFYLYETSSDNTNNINNTNNANPLNWEISSKRAQINTTNILFLEEDVEGNRVSEDLFKFQTDWLNFDLDKNLASSDAEILIWQAKNTASATGFDMDLNTSKIDIQLHNNVIFQIIDESK